MSVTPAAAFGLKAVDPGALTLKRILVVKPGIWNPRAPRLGQTMHPAPIVFVVDPYFAGAKY